MKINQKKLDKVTKFASIAGIDAMIVYYIAEIFTFKLNEQSWHQLVFLILLVTGFMPLLVTLHLKNVPKNIEAKLSYFLVFCCSTAVLFLLGFDTLNMKMSKDLVFNLVACIWFTFYIVVSLIKLFSKEVAEILIKENL